MIEQLFQARWLNQRRIPSDDDRGPKLALEGWPTHLDRVPGAQLFLLQHEFDFSATGAQFRPDRVRFVPYDDDMPADPRLFECIEDKVDHWAIDDAA